MQKLIDVWRYEALRQFELGAPFLSDTRVDSAAVEGSDRPQDWLIKRASQLSGTQGIDLAINRAKRWFWRTFLVLWFLSFCIGISAGLAALGNSAHAVNVIWAIGSLLVLPTLTLLIWFVSLAIGVSSGGWLGHGWQVLMDRVLKRDQDAVVWRAWLDLTKRNDTQQWWLSFATHTSWLWIMAGVAASFLFAFSLRHYTFMWQTTWLSAEVFVEVATVIGSLPALLGFQVPDAATITASGNVALDSIQARMSWANWLLGVIVVFGLLPRLLIAALSVTMLARRYNNLEVSTDDAYAMTLIDRLSRAKHLVGVDGPAAPDDTLGVLQGLRPEEAGSRGLVAALETSVPDHLLSILGTRMPVFRHVDDSQSRKACSAQLDSAKPFKLLIVVDACQTPDRGTLRSMLLFGSKAVETGVLLVNADTPRARLSAWQLKLQSIQVPKVFVAPDDAARWLDALS